MRRKQYHKTIDEFAESGKDFPIRCNASDNASYILKTIFRRAQSTVCIFTDRIDGEIFNNKDLILEVKRFLSSKEARLKIAYSNSDLSVSDVTGSEFLRNIIDSLPTGKIEIWDAKKATIAGINNHFFLNDQLEFRCGIGSKYMRANFGNKKFGAEIAFAFIEIISISDKVFG